MNYTEIGKLGFKISRFGFGAMRLPVIDGNVSIIDENEAISMIRYAVDNGVNYFDTSFVYHGGNSELLVGKALKDGYREKVHLTTKMPIWMVNTYEDFDRFLDLQLKKLDIEYLDFYLFHGLDFEKWKKLKKIGAIEFIEKAKNSGKIKHVGFSFHGELSNFKNTIDAYNWDMCQIQLNIVDEYYQAGREGLKYAAAKGIPVVIMEPLRGGGLAKNVPAIQSIWSEAKVQRNTPEWSFRWLCDFPEVTVILSGVSTMEQLKDNIRIFSDALPCSLTEEEHALIKRVQDAYKNLSKVDCSGCNFCVPCSLNVDIPEIFKQYNNSVLFNDMENGKKEYSIVCKTDRGALRCNECGVCETACPQHIKIIEKLKEADTFFTSK